MAGEFFLTIFDQSKKKKRKKTEIVLRRGSKWVGRETDEKLVPCDNWRENLFICPRRNKEEREREENVDATEETIRFGIIIRFPWLVVVK